MTPEEKYIQDKAAKFAKDKYTDRISTYAPGSSLNAVYENCLSDFSAGYIEALSEMEGFQVWTARKGWSYNYIHEDWINGTELPKTFPQLLALYRNTLNK